MKTSFHDVRGAVATQKATGWVLLVFLAARLAAANTSSDKPTVIALPTGVSEVEIQRALDSLPAVGGEVVLPAGKFEIHQPIILSRDHQSLSGAGAATILHVSNNANCPAIILGEPVNHPSRVVQDVCVSGLFIDGNRLHQDREVWKLKGEGAQIRNNGLTVQGVTGAMVQNVTATRCRSGGLVTARDVRHLTVSGFESFDNEFDGLACYETEDSVFENLNLHNNPGAGISLDLAFNHNIIRDAKLTANDLGIFMRSSRENQFLNVSIHDSHHHGVFMAHSETLTASGWAPAPKTECVYNAFTNLVAVNCGGAAFRVNNTTCAHNVLIGAKFEGNVKGGLSLAQPDLLTVR
jgi:Right handed beta helix region